MQGFDMSRLGWWFVDLLSQLLERAEREAVRGDIEESGEPAGVALRDVLGLVLRRQAEAWRDWRPWIVLVFVIVPLGMGLSRVSRMAADGSAVTLWMYGYNWMMAYLMNDWLRLNLLRGGAAILVEYLTLLSWSFTIGFALASVWRRLFWTNGFLFCIVLLYGELSGTPQYRYPWHDAVFSQGFYKTIYPATVQMVLVVIPALWEMREGRRMAALPPLCGAFAFGSAIMAVTPWVVFRTWHGPLSLGDATNLAECAALAPAACMVAIAIWRRWRPKARLLTDEGRRTHENFV